MSQCRLLENQKHFYFTLEKNRNYMCMTIKRLLATWQITFLALQFSVGASSSVTLLYLFRFNMSQNLLSYLSEIFISSKMWNLKSLDYLIVHRRVYVTVFFPSLKFWSCLWNRHKILIFFNVTTYTQGVSFLISTYYL